MTDHTGPETATAPHVLIAEDSPTQAAGLRAILAEKWDDVRCAKDGREALEMMREARPVIVISDIEMPRLGGYGLSRAMKSDPQLQGVPIILLSELASPQSITDAIDSSADCLLMKPCDPDRLLSFIERLVEDPGGVLAAGEADGAAVDASGRFDPRLASLRRLLRFTLEELADHHRRLIAAEEEVELSRAAAGPSGYDDLDGDLA